MLDLNGKVAVVTGAGSGIGRGIALELARAGASVVASDLLAERAEETATFIADLGGNALAVRADVREQESVQALAERVAREFGRLDIAIANAGIARIGSVLTMTEDEWSETVAVNQTGVFLTVQSCAREMVRAGNGGRIIVISSIAAEIASPGFGAYGATKAAVRHAARCWAFDLAPFGITVNSIGPGWVESLLTTDFFGAGEARAAFEAAIPLGRVAQPEEIGRLACWLASDEAAYITGSYNIIDGGLHDGRSAAETVSKLRDHAARLSGDALLATLDAEAEQARADRARRRAEIGLS
jgi:NAD(P)-dependent dehydrogenase (short-subunit alcohol dehydrogenase family)